MSNNTIKVKGGVGFNPIFSQNTPKFGFGDEQKWEKSIWKERKTNFLFFKIEKIPIFSHDAPKFGFEDGKKVYGKRGKKYLF